MAGYIEREKAIEAFNDPAVERYYGDVCPESVIHVIEQIPAADVQPVVRGRWITYPYMMGNTQYCSLCGENYGVKYNFCPNCGADMREMSKEE